MTNPADIDLEPYKEFPTQTTAKLIAAVEALRALQERIREVQKSQSDRVDFASLTQNRNSWQRAAEAAKDRVIELEKLLKTEIRRNANCMAWQARANAAEAHAAELTGALKWFDLHADSLAADLRSAHHSRGEGGSQWMAEDDRDFRADFRKAIEIVRAALQAHGPAKEFAT